MSKTIIWLLCILLLPGSSVFAKNTEKAPASAEDTFLMFRIDDADSSIYLMGSIHMGLPGFYPFPDCIEQAFQDSAYLVVELDPSSRENAAAMLEYQDAALLPDGCTIEETLSPGVYSHVGMVLDQLNMPLTQVKHFRPWSLSVLIPLLQLTAMGFHEEYGVDLHFLNQAKKAGKPVIELESVKEQMNLLLEMDTEDYLVYTLDSTESQKAYLDLVRAWRQGDVQGLERLIFKEPVQPGSDFSDIEEKMFTLRNKKMTDRIIEFLQDDEDYFVVVGSGHLVGEEGIAALLSRSGLPVIQETGR